MASLSAAAALLFLLGALLLDLRGVGPDLHRIFCLLGLSAILQTPRLAAGVFAEERRNQTLGLLFLSGLGVGEVFLSKLLSSALIALTDLLAMFPMLALPFLLGGVSFDLFVATVCALPTLLLFALAVSLLASVLTQDDGTAIIGAWVGVVLIGGVTPLLFFAQQQFGSGAQPSLWWLRLSPGYGPALIWRGFGGVPISEFWINEGITLAWSGLCLGVAGLALTALWREREAATQSGWRERLGELMHGGRRFRRRLGAVWLEANPFAYLAARDHQPATLAWLVVGGLVGIWLAGWAVWGRHWLSVLNLLFTAGLLNLATSWLIHFTAAKTLATPRQDGTYELLLTTSLQPSDIVWGTFEASRHLFQAVTRVVLGLQVLMLAAGLALRPWTPGALASYSMVWGFLLWWAWKQSRSWRDPLPTMWAGLNGGRPAAAMLGGFSLWNLIWIALCLPGLANSLALARHFPSGSILELVLVFLATTVPLVNTLLSARGFLDARECRLVAEFREIVREPLPDPDDPRFKKWDRAERFPWGWASVQRRLHERVARTTTGRG